MPLSKPMTYVVLAFFALAIYALSLDRLTRVALYVLPLWFALLAISYRLKRNITSS